MRLLIEPDPKALSLKNLSLGLSFGKGSSLQYSRIRFAPEKEFNKGLNLKKWFKAK